MQRKLEEMTKAELYEMAKKWDVRGRSKMTKEELVEALSENPARPNLSSGVLATATQASKRRDNGRSAKKQEAQPLEVSPEPSYSSAPQQVAPTPVATYNGEEGPHLPDRLPMTVLEAVPRDPYWVFLYWDVLPSELEKISKQHSQDPLSSHVSVLRLHDVNEGSWRDVPVMLDARNWYMPVAPGRSYRIELGVVLPGGRFVCLAVSRDIQTPPVGPSLEEGEEWLAVEEYYRELMEAHGEFAPGSLPGSPGGQWMRRRELARVGWPGGVSSITSWGVRR